MKKKKHVCLMIFFISIHLVPKTFATQVTTDDVTVMKLLHYINMLHYEM